MSALSSALAAMGKTTPGPWIAKLCLGGSYVIDNTLPENKGLVRNIAEVSGHLSTSKDAALIAAAPDMAAWIEKALPWVESERAYHQEMVDTLKSETGENGALTRMHMGYVSELDALLAEAKGDNHAKH